MSVLPSLYISHGSPMTALRPGELGTQLATLAQGLPRPRAIVVASAHWLARRPLVGAASKPVTIHDFGGFPPPLYEIEYPAPGGPALAQQVTRLLELAGLHPQQDPQRGLDHGIWVPLRMLYPQADIPVVPLSIQPELGPAHQFAVGRALAPLRAEGVLVIGSGSITHNLHDLHQGYSAEREAPYVRPFIDWTERRLADDDVPALLDYRRQAPHAARAHPTDEHLLPLYVAMGAAGGDRLGAQRIDAGIDQGLIGMDIYRFDGAPAVDQPVAA
ncbi:class III extradiol ring-cleavage dioxygenase [Xanthomonas campestris pv. raphani]|uniref:DODA-type extradiol aromatic ring-opening family dioxygenase n=1 Tax=Xanthomonas campestris TaxID=339 RepID=UPI002B23427E|nr:class III extradiol ring-cleavage dioxygenase [Xanthomonas campestris]MEA9747382.1 class III extradiol ring-cleavage dioxygenase [Xanthomonas campestris pv. raphani]MEA9847662.1 class III extradiol ring-cleavage dioxygenase [Xanthomonas campestris pv. raphani]MEA9929126.1 class III extradiol ring-cleavage dioxygenase [Xanthomonas campestris pv. raphani]